MNGHACSYDRHYLYKISPDASEPQYTVIIEMSFPSRAVFEQRFADVAADTTLNQFVAEDEARFVNRESALCYRTTVSTSALEPLALNPSLQAKRD